MSNNHHWEKAVRQMAQNWLDKKGGLEIVLRTQIKEFSNDLYERKTLQNLDSLGRGPKTGDTVLDNGRVYYHLNDLVEWMINRGGSKRGRK